MQVITEIQMQCFKKQDIGKTKKKAQPDLKWQTPQASQASPNGGKDIENSLGEPRAELRPRPQKGSNNQFTKKNPLNILDLVHSQTAGAVADKNCSQMALQTS